MQINTESSIYRRVAQIVKWVLKHYLANPVRAVYIAVQRNRYMDSVAAGRHGRVIIFLSPNRNLVNGGIMSIISIAKETEKLRSLHDADVFVCAFPRTPALLRYTKFRNDRVLLDFQTLVDRFDEGAEILVHIPDVSLRQFVSDHALLLKSLRHRWHFNLMLQNIDYLPQREDMDVLSGIGSVTVTTAHKAYSNAETQQALGAIVHHLSAWTSFDPYERKSFRDRENVIVVSPDLHERREEVLTRLQRLLPDFRFVTVRRMSYANYRKLIAKAKFSLTFGEGFDAYFTEIIFGGGIGCAVYNDRFFTQDLSQLRFVYPSWDELLSRLPSDIRQVDVPGEFERHSETAHRLILEQATLELYRSNLFSYYERYFSISRP
jgi:hypothetical protein